MFYNQRKNVQFSQVLFASPIVGLMKEYFTQIRKVSLVINKNKLIPQNAEKINNVSNYMHNVLFLGYNFSSSICISNL